MDEEGDGLGEGGGGAKGNRLQSQDRRRKEFPWMGKSSLFEYARGIENGKRNTLKGWDLGDRVLIKARVGEH